MAKDVVIPQAGESVTSGVLGRWLKGDGEYVKRDEAILELETDKVNLEVAAPASGVLKHLAKAGDNVTIGQRVGSVDETAKAPAGAAASAGAPVAAQAGAKGSAAPASKGATATAEPPENAGDLRATPLARKIAQEHGVDLAQVHASGAGNRIREQDVMEFIERRSKGGPKGGANGAAPARAELAGGPREATRERLSPLRQRIASRLVQAQHTAAMLTTFNECDMSGVLELRKQYKEEFEKRHGVGLGFMGFFVKAVVHALQAIPNVNAYLVEDASGDTLVERHAYHDVAVAVSTPKGLVVPVVRDCQSLSLAGIESRIKDLATRARDGKLTLEEMQGGTFTITNGGIFGSLLSTPILNPPQSAILGMHAIKNRPVEHPAGSGQIALRPMMYLALSYDHRIIDGSEAVQFLVKVKQAIEDPQRLLLGV